MRLGQGGSRDSPMLTSYSQVEKCIAADVFALGLVLWLMCTGALPCEWDHTCIMMCSVAEN